MYCDKCHKQSPENFESCAYCGAKLDLPEKHEPSRFIKKREIKFKLSFKHRIGVLVLVAVVLVVAAIFTSSFTAAKPEKLIKSFVKATQTADEEMYYNLYDDNIKKYKLDNRYFGEDETFEQMVLPMEQSNTFYVAKCGEGYKLSYNVKSSKTLSDTEKEDFREVLEKSFDYVEFPSRVDVISVEIIAKGEKGEYKSLYNDFWCMKIKGRWYKVDKTIYTEYINTQE